MKKKSQPRAKAIGPCNIWLPDIVGDQLAAMRAAVIAGSRAGKPRGIFAQVSVHNDFDGIPHLCLTCYCPTHEDGARFIKAVNRLNLFKKKTP